MSCSNVSSNQLLCLVSFMEKHSDLGVKHGRKISNAEKDKLWFQLHKLLNAINPGSKRTIQQWYKFWSSKKSSIRRKIKKKKLNVCKDLSPLEERIMKMVKSQWDAKENKVKQEPSMSKSLIPPKEEFPTTESKKWFIKPDSSDTDTSNSSIIGPTFPRTIDELIKGITHIDSNHSSHDKISNTKQISSNVHVSDNETESAEELQTLVKQETIDEVLPEFESIFNKGSPNSFDVSTPLLSLKDKLPSFSEIVKHTKSPNSFMSSAPLPSLKNELPYFSEMVKNTESPNHFTVSEPLLPSKTQPFRSSEIKQSAVYLNHFIIPPLMSSKSQPSRSSEIMRSGKSLNPFLVSTPLLSSTNNLFRPIENVSSTESTNNFIVSTTSTSSKNKVALPILISAAPSSAVECAKLPTIANIAPTSPSSLLTTLDTSVSASSLKNQVVLATHVSSTMKPISNLSCDYPLKSDKSLSSVIGCKVNSVKIPLQEHLTKHAKLSVRACIVPASPLTTPNTSVSASSLKSQVVLATHVSSNIESISNLRCDHPLKSDKSWPSVIGCNVNSLKIPLQEHSIKHAKLSAMAPVSPSSPLATSNTSVSESSLKNQGVPVTRVSSTMEPLSDLRCDDPLKLTDESQSSGIGCDVKSKRRPLQALQKHRLKHKKAATTKKVSQALTFISGKNCSALERIAKAVEIQAAHTAKQTKLIQKIHNILTKK